MSGVNDTWLPSPHVCFVDDGERVVLLDLSDPRSAHPMLLRGSAASVWRIIANGASTSQVVTAMTDEYVGAVQEISEDIDRTLGKLRVANLIVAHAVSQE